MIESKEKELLEFIGKFKSVLVAFSGGLDSSVVLWASIKALGAENVLAVTSESASFASSEGISAREAAREVGLPPDRHIFIRTEEMNNPDYVKNPSNRCYYCKSELFSQLKKIAEQKNIEAVFDGANVSDNSDFRPGQRAAQRLEIVSPLKEGGFDKEMLRELARKYELSFAERPAAACLASRIPYGTRITVERLKKVETAEAAVRAMGFEGFRVRYHGEVARLELRPDDIKSVIDNGTREKLVTEIKKAGFKFVALDLEGYRTGSLNRMLTEGEKDNA